MAITYETKKEGNFMKYNKGQKALLVLTLSMVTFILTSPSPAPTEAATQSVSPLVTKIQQSSKPVTKNNGKPAPQIKIFVNNTPQTLADPVIMDNGRVFLPVRALANLLNIHVNYLDTYKVATASNSTAYLELPLGYNKAIKDKTLTLAIDANNTDTRIITYNSRTYLPVRFISENLGYNISYAYQTVSITTDGSSPVIPSKPAQLKPEPVKNPEFKLPNGIPSGAVLTAEDLSSKAHQFIYDKSLSDGSKIAEIVVYWPENYPKPVGSIYGTNKNGERFSLTYTRTGGLTYKFAYIEISQDSWDEMYYIIGSFFDAYGY